jgi:adenosylmethionine-8-amino-7-oxononanoate aminotransferase
MQKNLRMSLSKRDSKTIWHPLTQHKTAKQPLAIIKAKAALLYDENGKEYIDAVASWYTAMYGHCNDYILIKAYEQMQTLDQIVFTGFTHEPAVKLSEELLSILPNNQAKVMFNDNGSTSVEIGIKMALQYHHNNNEKRDTLLAFENGFHGDTFGAMSVSGLSVYNGAFDEHFLKVVRIPTPDGNNNDDVLKQLNALIKTHDIAGFVYEPLVQGAAGMKMYDAQGLQEILKICKENTIITVADEVMTGFGKTGSYFASLNIKELPDVMCLSKALTAGLVPMGITTCSQHIYDAFLDDNVGKGLFHAHTYSANPIACATALAGLELLQSQDIKQQQTHIIKSHGKFLNEISSHPKVLNPRQNGVILAFEINVEMERYGDLRNKLFQFFMDKGIYLRPLGNTIYVLPPYVITEAQLQAVYNAILDALESFS